MIMKTVTIWELATYVVTLRDDDTAAEDAMTDIRRIGLVSRVTGAAAGFNPPTKAVKRIAETSQSDLEAAQAVLPEARPDVAS